MAYEATGATAVDFSHGTCGPGMYKWHPNGTCQALPWGLRAPEYGGSSHADPTDSNVGYSRGITDFSGGSCGSGMIKPGPAQPCQVIQQGMAMGELSFRRVGEEVLIGVATLLAASIVIHWLKPKIPGIL